MKEFTVEILKPGQPVEVPERTIQLLPTHLYVLPTGSMLNEPSLALILSTRTDPVVVTQLSLRMLVENSPTELLVAAQKFLNREINLRNQQPKGESCKHESML